MHVVAVTSSYQGDDLGPLAVTSSYQGDVWVHPWRILLIVSVSFHACKLQYVVILICTNTWKVKLNEVQYLV